MLLKRHSGPTRRTRSLYRQVVTSFVSYLLAAYGPEPFKTFFKEFDPDHADRAAETAFGEPMAVLEKEWLAALLRPPVPEGNRAVPGGIGTTAGPGPLAPEGPEQSTSPPGIMSFLRGAVVYLRPYWKQQVLILLAAAVGALFVVLLPKREVCRKRRIARGSSPDDGSYEFDWLAWQAHPRARFLDNSELSVDASVTALNGLLAEFVGDDTK